MAFVRRLTGKGVGGIGVLAVAGEGARDVVGQVAKSKRVGKMGVGEVVRTTFVHGEVRLDDGLVVRVAEGVFELHLHGGLAVMEGVVGALLACGANVREAGGDGLEEALAKARTMTGVRLLAGVGLAQWARGWLERVEVRGEEGALWRAQSEAQWILERSEGLGWLLEMPRVAIVGAPNAGKSTLANALLGRPVSITSEVAGTTRDWVDAECVLACGEVAVAVTLVDTAGVRETGDVIERESIERTHAQAAAADVVIVLVDGVRAEWGGVRALMERLEGRRVALAVNKGDVAGVVEVPEDLPRGVVVSAKERWGLDGLMGAVMGQLDVREVGSGEAFAYTEQQRERLRGVGVARDWGQARRELGALV